MNKFLFSAILLLIYFNCNAQWHTTHFEKDDLKGTEEHDAYVYSCDIATFTWWSDDASAFRIKTINGIFDVEHNGDIISMAVKGSSNYVNGLFGFYDCNNTLILKRSISYIASSEGYDKVFLNGKHGRNIIDYLEHKKGYVRFIIGRYNDSDLDFKVPCKNNCE
jgi:hypothetical protein